MRLALNFLMVKTAPSEQVGHPGDVSEEFEKKFRIEAQLRSPYLPCSPLFPQSHRLTFNTANLPSSRK